MNTTEGLMLSTSLADFETTTSHLLRPREARVLLNFAALFHERLYLSDTALGDHELIIKSYQQDGNLGLFGHVRALIEARILKVLFRDKVVVRDKVRVPTDPTLSDIFEGWVYRDSTEWGGERGFTTDVRMDFRSAYNRYVHDLLSRHDAIQRYDPDIPKAAFRDRIRDLLNRESPSMLSESVSRLPTQLRRKYLDATEDDRFTNADLWRVLKQAEPDTTEAIILHAHVYQQCFADLTESGQCGHDRGPNSLASFNLELQRREPWSPEGVDATIEPPSSLDEILERAQVHLPPLAIEVFDQLSVENVISLRGKADEVFRLARKQVEPTDVEWFREKYLRALTTYWENIVESLEELHPKKLFHSTRAGLFVDRELPTLSKFYKNFGRGTIAWLLQLPPWAENSAGRFSILLFRKRKQEFKDLIDAVPPDIWAPHALLSLDRGMPIPPVP